MKAAAGKAHTAHPISALTVDMVLKRRVAAREAIAGIVIKALALWLPLWW